VGAADSSTLAEAPGDPAGYELAFREAIRSIELQNESLGGLRSRAATLISAAALVAGFFGPVALDRAGSLTWWTAALLMFGGALGAVYLMLPIKEWTISSNTHRLLAEYVDAGCPIAELHRSLAYHIQVDWDRNEEILIRRNQILAFSATCVVAETLAWLLTVAGV
jgi:hypothetical protein